MERRKLIQPKSAMPVVRDLFAAGSPIKTFADDIGLEAGDHLRIGIDDLFMRWGTWCGQNGIRCGSKPAFGRNLRSVFPKIKDGKLHKGGPNCYVGIGIPEQATLPAGAGSGMILEPV